MQYEWSFSGGTPALSTDSAPVVFFNMPGDFGVTLIATTPQGCSDTVQSQVTVHPTPDAQFVVPQICEGLPVTISNLTSIDPSASVVGYQWFFTGGSIDTSSSFEPVVSFVSSGTDSVLLITTSSDGCIDSVSGLINVLPRPVASFSLTDACFGDAILVSDSSSIAVPGEVLDYSWSSASGQFSSSTSPAPQILFPAPGTYPVTLITTSVTGCSDTALRIAIVHTLPAASFTAPPVCLGQNTVFDNQTAIDSLEQYTFIWSFPAAIPTTSNAFEPAVIFGDTGQSPVQLVVQTGYGCLDTIDQFVTVYRPPQAVVSNGDSSCVPICHSFSDMSVQGDGYINQWVWSFPGGYPSTFSGQTPPEVCYTTPGTYDIELKVTSSIGCASSMKLTDAIRGYSIPEAGFFVAEPTTNIFAPSFQFRDTSSADVVRWSWDFGDGTQLSSTETSPVHSYSSSVTENDFYHFLVTLIVTTRYGCIDTVNQTIDIKPEFTFYAPNAFTPNGDAANQYFFGKGIGVKRYSMRIFDRWGLQLWSCEEEGSNLTWDAIGSEGMPSSCKWDGTYAGRRVEADVYVWQVSLTDIFGVDHSYTGRVSVAY
jgi:gliding motility-associated-like protein